MKRKAPMLPDYYMIVLSVWPDDGRRHVSWQAENKQGKGKRGTALTVEEAEFKARLWCCG